MVTRTVWNFGGPLDEIEDDIEETLEWTGQVMRDTAIFLTAFCNESLSYFT